MKRLLSLFIVVLNSTFTGGCATHEQVTSQSTIQHSWHQAQTHQNSEEAPHIGSNAEHQIEARPGYHTYVDPRSGQIYSILYFVDLKWSGSNVAIPNNPNQRPTRWLTHAADIELTAKSFRFDEEGVQDWIDGPPVQLDLVSGFNCGSNSGEYLRVSAECLFYVGAEQPIFPKSYKGRTIRLPIEFTIYDGEKVVVNGYDYPKNDLNPGVSFDHWEIPFQVMKFTFSNGTSSFDDSSLGYMEYWELTEEGWVQTDRK